MKMSTQETFKIFCGNLSSITSDSDLNKLFSKYGSVVEAVVMTGKNYGFVHMSTEEEGIKALTHLNGHLLNGEKLAVQRSINSRRASITTKHVPHQNIIGKGVGSMDDFESYTELNDRSSPFSDKAVKTLRPHISSSPVNLVSYASTLNPASSSTLSESSSGRPSPLQTSSPQTPEHVVKAKIVEPEYPPSLLNNTKDNSLCGVCLESYDALVRVPKILSCNHTFCSQCLSSIAKGLVIKCPYGCPYITNLLDSGVSGLTTNQTVPIQNDSFFRHVLQPIDNQKERNLQKEVCCMCLCIPPTQYCLHQGHQLISETEASLVLKPKLQSLLEFSVKQLRIVMTIRASLKERMQSTMHSLAKFSEELKMKIEGEELEEAMQHSLLSELNQVSESLLGANSLHDLLSTCTKVQSYAQNISSQYSQCAAKTSINDLIDSIVLKLKRPGDLSFGQLGFSSEEAFSMASTLEENANKGNFANVLLIYLLCDLLTTRHNPNPITTLHSYFSPTPHSFGNLPAQMAPLHENKNENHLNEDIEDHSGMFDINEVLKTTEAIESSSPLNGNLGYPSHSESASPPIVSSALSLGLSNVSLIYPECHSNGAAENGDEIEKNDIKPSSYLDALKKPAKVVAKPVITSPKINPNPVKPTKFPHCWMVISIDGEPAGRVIFQLRPDKAPKMCDNFIGLCTGRSGYSYKGCHFFKSGEGFLVGGDVENDDGTGGYSIYDKQKFEADLCPLKDDVGMVRFKGIGTNDSGRGMVGSQFMIWYTEREFKKFSFSLVFGRVVDGLDIVQKAANRNLSVTDVKVEECGAI